MSLMTKQIETKGLLRVGFAAVCVVIGVATCGSALALRLDVNEPPPATAASTAAAAASSRPRVVRVASGVEAGSKIDGENPKYPAEAREAKVSGTVVLHAIISKTGAVANLQVTSGPEELRASAIDAVRTWHYKPFILNGDPVAVDTTINVNYSLGN